jgi:hypothetical protein
MSFTGLESSQADIVAKAGTVEPRVKDALRRPRVSAPTGWWPDTGTVLRAIAVLFVVIVLAGWLLTALNH